MNKVFVASKPCLSFESIRGQVRAGKMYYAVARSIRTEVNRRTLQSGIKGICDHIALRLRSYLCQVLVFLNQV